MVNFAVFCLLIYFTNDSAYKVVMRNHYQSRWTVILQEGENMEPDPMLELYKLEYERCAIRFEDIYKAIWTNFSYLSVVAGAILTFGSTYLNTDLAAFVACFPLLFWYWATFLPLDRYGDDALDRLKELERLLNEKYKTQLDHYTGFLRTKKPDNAPNAAQSQVHLRARHAIKAFFFLLHVIAILLSYKLYGLPISAVLGVFTYCLYVCTHLQPPRPSVKFALKAIFLLAVGGVLLYLLIKTPMPQREKETKKIMVTNQDGVINIKPDGEQGEVYVIQLVGFDGVALK